jgi:hypothetical protein
MNAKMYIVALPLFAVVAFAQSPAPQGSTPPAQNPKATNAPAALCPESRSAGVNSTSTEPESNQCASRTNFEHRRRSGDDDTELLRNSDGRFVRRCRVRNEPSGRFHQARTWHNGGQDHGRRCQSPGNG